MKPAGLPTITFLLLLIVALSFVTTTAVSQPLPGPARPIGQSTDTITFDAAIQAAGTLPRLHSLLVNWRNERVVEKYFNGMHARRQANLKSASKSVISALIGIALDRGFLEDVRQPIGSFFPGLLEGAQAVEKGEITIEDLLTMRSGLETTSNRNYGAWVTSPNWVRFALHQPFVSTPGTRMIYSTGNTHLLSAILTRAAGASTWRFAQDFLAKPLGFELPQWPRDPQGVYFGGNDMTMTPSQMMAFGRLYLQGGRANGSQVVPDAWVKASLVARTPSPRERGRFYGYGWWIRQMAGHATFYAWGYGGQFIFLIPDLDLVVVTTSASTPGEGRRGHLRRIYEIVESHIVRPVASTVSERASIWDTRGANRTGAGGATFRPTTSNH